MTKLEKKILNLIQHDFPITEKPYKKLADIFNISENKILEILKKLKKSGIIRRITPSFSLEKMKYESILAAARIPMQNMKKAENFINKHKEITHNYMRKHEYNFWFTIAALSRRRIEQVIKEIEEQFDIKILTFPKIKEYKLKIHTKF